MNANALEARVGHHTLLDQRLICPAAQGEEARDNLGHLLPDIVQSQALAVMTDEEVVVPSGDHEDATPRGAVVRLNDKVRQIGQQVWEMA